MSTASVMSGIEMKDGMRVVLVTATCWAATWPDHTPAGYYGKVPEGTHGTLRRFGYGPYDKPIMKTDGPIFGVVFDEIKVKDGWYCGIGGGYLPSYLRLEQEDGA